MNGEPKAAAEAWLASSAAPPGPRGEIAALLLRDGVLTEAQLRHAERVRGKLPAGRPLIPLLIELGLVSPEALKATLQAHRLGLRIGALLVELGHLREADLEAALRLQEACDESSRKLGEILVENGLLGAQQLAEVLSSQLDVPCVPPGRLEPDQAVSSRAPLAICRRHRFVPLRAENGRIAVAFVDPLDKADAAAAQRIFGTEIAPWIVTLQALDATLAQRELSERVSSDVSTGERAAAQALDEILAGALRESASEVHVEPGPQRLLVRLRRDGVLCVFRELPTALAAPLVRRLELEAGVETEQGAPHREGWIRLEHEQRLLHIRASFLATAFGESMVLRVRDSHRPALALEALGLLPPMHRRLEEEALGAAGGVFLLCGPAGSGRTATLHACAAGVAGLGVRVVLLEETLEARLEGVSQSVLAPAAVLTLAERVEVALRQDPDVLALGALRDRGDLATALGAARFGPRVVGVLEAEDAVAALLRSVDAGSVQGFAPPSLVGALAQRLVRRVCDYCAEPVVPSAGELRRLGCTALELAGGSFRRGRGCGRCRETGYDGRIGIFELLVLDEAGRDHLRGGESAGALRRSAAMVGPATLLEDGLLKAARGMTSLEELLRVLPRASRPRPLADIERSLGEAR